MADLSIEEMIYNEVKETRKEVKAQSKCITGMKVAQEKTNGKIHVMQNEMKHIQNDCSSLRTEFENHEDDDDVHYNDAISNETNFQKARRNVVPYTMAGGSISAVLIGVAKVIEWWLANNG